MSSTFPTQRIRQKHKEVISGDNAILSNTIAVSANNYGIVYRIWLDLDVQSETDLENLGTSLELIVAVGATSWSALHHPLITHTAVVEHRWVDLGPWFYEFGVEGLYSGIKGDDIVLTVEAAGTGIKTAIHIMYSDD